MITQTHKLIIAIGLLLYSFNVSAQNFIVDGINYNVVTQDRTCEVIANPTTPYAGNVKIPGVVTNNGKTLSVIAIGNNAFNGCTGLTSITIPSGVTSIGEKAFAGCNALKEVISWNKVAPTTTKSAFDTSVYENAILKVPVRLWDIYASAEGWKEFRNIKAYLYENCFLVDGIYYDIIEPDKSCIVIPSQTTPYAGNVIIPGVVTNNGKTLNVIAIGNEAFDECHELTSITIPNGVIAIGYRAFNECDKLTSVEIPNGVTSIGIRAFSYCVKLTSVKMPNGVTSIGNAAFNGCEKLTSISIPNSVTSIGDVAFGNCRNLTSIKIPSGVTSIGERTFYGCDGLESVEIPNGVTSIGDQAFEDCLSLGSIEIPSGVTSIGNYTFRHCHKLTSVEIPNGVTSIGEYAFDNCQELTSITIPNSVTSIGNYAFHYCIKLTSVKIPNGVTSIGSGAFSGCESLTAMILPSGVTSIEYGAFSDCNGLESIEMPSGLTSIGSSAFNGCDRLTSIEIPSGVTSIGDYAFMGCDALREVMTLNSVPPTCGDSFDFVAYENATLRVPEGSLDAYKLAEGWKKFMNIKDDLSGVEDATANEPKISIIGEVIIIEGVDDDANVEVYNVAGMLVYSGVSKTISTPATGIYILKIAGRSYKIAVK